MNIELIVISFLLLAIGVMFLLYFIDDQKKLNNYSKRWENIYVVGEVANESKSSSLAHLSHLIEFTDNVYVESVVAANKRLLERAKNPFHSDPDLTEKGKIQVKPIIFQDASHVNETEAKYLDRIVAEIEADRLERHAIMKRTNPDWYALYGNFQKGVKFSQK